MGWGWNQRGFTIVELLIVVVVIAILAAITIVSYNGITSRANEAAIKADLSNFGKKMAVYHAEYGVYPSTLTQDMGISFNKGIYGDDYQNYNVRYCRNPSDNRYVLLASLRDGRYFKIDESGSVTTNPATYGYGVCNLIGLTNTNPSHNGYYSVTNTWAAWVN